MNEKMTIQDLIDLLAEKHGMEKKDAESFVKEFFLLIEESLAKDKYVKIKGLGTFRLIDVESRGSINVNTGERIEIQGHTKVSFSPEQGLKEVINKPFAHFEAVVLNENTLLEDTPVEKEGEDEEEVETVVQAAEEIKREETSVEAESAEEEVIGDAVKEVAEEESAEPEKETGESSTMKYFIGFVVLVVLLCGGAVAFMYYPDLKGTMRAESTMEEVAEKTIETAETEETVETIKTDTVAEKLPLAAVSPVVAKKQDSANTDAAPEPVVKKEVVKKEKKKTATPFVTDSVGYTIVGTETTYTIKEGETLTRVALRFYGTKALWPYIVKHNPKVIKNPNNVPFGTTIKIPKLVKK